jgi:DNA-binding transcriptional regulator YiaG
MSVLTKSAKGRGSAALRVRPVRHWFGLSQERFARALGVGRATVARWEAANSGPTTNSAEGRLLIAMMEARDLATKQFGPQNARRWLDGRAPTFGGETPRSVLVTRGPLPVRDLLLAGWEGAYS